MVTGCNKVKMLQQLSASSIILSVLLLFFTWLVFMLFEEEENTLNCSAIKQKRKSKNNAQIHALLNAVMQLFIV